MSFCRIIQITGQVAGIWLVATGILCPQAAAQALEQHGNLYAELDWSPESVLELHITPPGQPQPRVTLHIEAGAVSLDLSPAAGFLPRVTAGFQPTPQALPKRTNRVEFVFVSRHDQWRLFLGRRLIVSLPAALPPPFLVSASLRNGAQTNAAPLVDPFFQKTGAFVFDDTFMRASEEEAPLGQWDTVSGSWTLHSVLEDVDEDIRDNNRKRGLPNANMSPNFYSLEGTGPGGLLLAGHPFYDDYEFAAAIRLGDEGEAGLVFYHQEDGGYGLFNVAMDNPWGPARLSLRRIFQDGSHARTQTVAAAEVPLSSGQWVRPSVWIRDHRVRCMLNNTPVFETDMRLPPGGRFGLFVDGAVAWRFDDVNAASKDDLRLDNPGDVARNLLEMDAPGASRASSEEGILHIAAAARDQWFVLGNTNDPPHVFEARFTLDDDIGDVGLTAGGTEAGIPRLVFRRTLGPEGESVQLLRSTTNGFETLKTRVLPAEKAHTGREVCLRLDATDALVLKAYRDGELVLHTPLPDELRGGSGCLVGAHTAASIGRLQYAFQVRDRYESEYEKNPIFIRDPFMRLWSSPEGEWLLSRDGTNTWHKGDFLGAFSIRLPHVPGAELHLGVPEDGSEGRLVIHFQEGGLLEIAPPDITNGPRVVQTELPPPENGADGKPVPRAVTVHGEDYGIWLSSGGKLLVQLDLERPFEGRRVFVRGMQTKELAQSHVWRSQVKEFLFTRSPYEWNINGGTWAVVNRFECQPRWSHMIGQNAQGPAGLWSRFLFGGDFCMEMYAGFRHNWYERCGDLNLTIMNAQPVPGRGYTVTCSGWDPDHSQRHTRLWREGRVVARTDQYLVPRYRRGNVRRGYAPLVPKGRDVHGAWYYIKLRRIGSRLEYSFDNETALVFDDPDPIPNGSMGIWTFMNSMTVARVRVTADEIRPRPLTVTPLAADAAPQAPAPPSPAAARLPLAGPDAVPLDWMDASLWFVDDDAGRSRMSWTRDAHGQACMVVSNSLGAGRMFAACSAPAVPAARLAGWQMQIKRSSGARLNLHFSCGRKTGDGSYTPKHQFVYRLNGTELVLAGHSRSGESALPAAPTGSNWQEDAGWTPVTVWIPPNEQHLDPADEAQLVRFEGFGNRQAGDVLQGLTGNGPGEAYAVKDMRPVFYGTPALVATDAMATQSLDRITVVDPPSGRVLAAGATLDAVNAAFRGIETEGLHEALLSIAEGAVTNTAPLLWLQPQTAPELRFTWDQAAADRIAIQWPAGSPHRSVRSARLTVNGAPASALALQNGGLTFDVPATSKCLASNGPLRVTCVLSAYTNSAELAWDDRPVNGPPQLLGLGETSPIRLYTFESAASSFPPAQLSRGTMSVVSSGEQQGHVLRVANLGARQRLDTTLPIRFNLAEHPLLGLRYRGDDMADLSLQPGPYSLLRFSEQNGNARVPRNHLEPVMDNAWHTWCGWIADVLPGTYAPPPTADADRVRFYSAVGEDQTGWYSRWMVDDVALGPAVSDPASIRLTPEFFDFDGLRTVRYACLPGPRPYDALTDSERAAVIWHESPAGQSLSPIPTDLPDGIVHVLLAAEDALGCTSGVTDLPVLLDRTAPAATVEIIPPKEEELQTPLLKVTIKTGEGSPARLKELVLKTPCGDLTLCQTPTARSVLEPHSATLFLNYAYLLRSAIDAATNGQALAVSLDGIRDGAGNESPAVACTIAPGTPEDRFAPQWLTPAWPSNVLWAAPWAHQTEHPGHLDVGFGGQWGGGTLNQRSAEGAFLHMTLGDHAGTLERAFPDGTIPLRDLHLGFCLRFVPSTTNQPLPEMRLRIDAGGQSFRRRIGLPQDRLVDAAGNPTWCPVILNLERVAERHSKRHRETEPLDVEQASLTRFVLSCKEPKSKGMQVDLCGLFLFSTWQPEHKVTVQAYDASGIAGYTTSSGAVSKDGTFKPAEGESWIIVRARDGAGHESPPLWIPVGREDAGVETEQEEEQE